MLQNISRIPVKSARDNIDSLVSEVNSILDPMRDKKFVVFHDAYQYFERTLVSVRF